jgi:hypothetical protein
MPRPKKMLSCSISCLNFSFLFQAFANATPAAAGDARSSFGATTQSTIRPILKNLDLDKFAFFTPMSNLIRPRIS